MRIVPVLLQPRLLTLKNRWFKSGRRGLKECAALTVSALMMWGIYTCTLSSLHDMKRLAPQSTIDPAIPLGMMLVALFTMIFLSATVSAVGALFLSKDLDLTISAPLSPGEFLLGKTVDVGLSVSWMICTFGLPALLAFGSFYHGGIIFVVAAPLLCLGFFALATSLGVVTALIVAALLPSERSKPLYVLVLLVLLAGGTALLHGFGDRPPLQTSNPTALIQQAAAVALNPWLPSSHCARALTGLLQREYLIPLLAAVEYIGMISLLGFCMRSAFIRLYDRGLSRTRSSHSFFRIHSRGAQRISRLLFPFASPTTRAIMAKEYKVFSRDVTHTMQLGLLLGITFVYLYNYQLLEGPIRASTEVRAVWNIFLLLSNIALGSLVITSICSRFVFPSVSLEGNTFWLIQAAPISLRELLKAKFKSWLTPVSCIGGVVFISGAMALNADVPLVLASCAAGIIICHGLVGIGVGLGALFSHFEWEHSTQISTSMGSFIFMLVSMIFLGLNMIPLGLMFGTYLLFPEHVITPQLTFAVLGTGLLCTYLLNKGATWWALSLGARALQPR
jgi:ABC-2 type transport system permease protein